MDDRGKKIHIQVPDSVRYILKTIRDAGYEAYIVGGCVRDSLLVREPGDWDITTSALPEQVKKLFSITVDTGIQHGTVMVIRGGCGYEVTTYRVDGEYKDGRHPESVTFTPNLEEDLKRRDFTINAFAYDPNEGVVDLFNGMDDLKNGVIRAVGDPRKRFDEDALRIMRAIRFSAQLSFEIEKETKDAIAEFAPRLALVSAERIRVEFEKTLFSDNPAYVNEYRRLGLARYIVPDVYDKCFLDKNKQILDNITDGHSETGKILRLAAFFSELTDDECRKAMRRMTFDNRSRDLVSGILKFKAGSAETQGGSDEELRLVIRKELRRMGLELFELLLRFRAASGGDVKRLSEQLQMIKERGDAYSISMLSVTGEDLLEAGVPQGRQIGEKLNLMLDRVIENPALNNKCELLKIISEV